MVEIFSNHEVFWDLEANWKNIKQSFEACGDTFVETGEKLWMRLFSKKIIKLVFEIKVRRLEYFAIIDKGTSLYPTLLADQH